MKHKNLKRGIYCTLQNGKHEVERYVIENLQDLKKFFTKFPDSKKLMMDNFKKCLDQGHVVIATDVHPMSGHPTYCLEDRDNSTHPGAFTRVNLL